VSTPPVEAIEERHTGTGAGTVGAAYNGRAHLCALDTMPSWLRATEMNAPIRTRRKRMKPLSEQLSDLAARAKQAEEAVATARAKNRAALESERDRLKSSVTTAKTKAQANTAAAQEDARSWWDETRADVNERFEGLRAKRDAHRAERDLTKAENRADDAELDASDAIDFAEWAVDQAEYSVVDAIIARDDADQLAPQRSP
jgi:DNA repair exonuclease SbcCD ATPase subunit